MQKDTQKVLQKIIDKQYENGIGINVLEFDNILNEDLYKYADYVTSEMYFQATEKQFKDYVKFILIEKHKFYEQYLVNASFINTKYDIEVIDIMGQIDRYRMAKKKKKRKEKTLVLLSIFVTVVFAWNVVDGIIFYFFK